MMSYGSGWWGWWVGLMFKNKNTASGSLGQNAIMFTVKIDLGWDA